MGEVVRFIPKAERERIRLIRAARALYDSVFPPTNSVNEQRNKASIARSVNAAWVHHGDEILS
jgi:hypothetical protein